MIYRLTTILLIFFVSGGCASVESRWQAAQKQDTVAAYEAFLRKCPETPYASTARERLANLRLEEAQKAGTVQALEVYLREYPDRSQAAPLREQVKQLKFEQAKRSGSITEMELFIAQYPGDPLSQQLEQERSRLRGAAATRQLGELLIAWASAVGEVHIHLRPVTNAPEVNRQNGAQLRRLLAAGADADAIRIAEFSPVLRLNSRSDSGMTSQFQIAGNPGHVVSAEQGGTTLLEYCRVNKLDEACAILQASREAETASPREVDLPEKAQRNEAASSPESSR